MQNSEKEAWEKKCVIFDLDGTLCNTLEDIAKSVNETRKDYGLELLPLEKVVTYIGDGALKLLQRSFADHPIDWEEGLAKMVTHYHDSPVVRTTLYPGVAQGLALLKEHGWNLAVVTNKPGIVAREILRILEITPFLDDIIGGGDGFELKPNPSVMFHLLKKYHVRQENAWVLGDNHTDMDSAANAGMNGAFATWGFGSLANAQCTVKTDSFRDFTSYLLQN